MSTSPTVSRPANRLAGEKSPYLLQHQRNPVDWYPWGNDAFALARKLDRPIFLSIGYSTCHWCHVMERESFESEPLAALLNRHFVSVKVDREERPDVDKIYMTALQATGQGGGWPLNVFLTPDLKPFYGGTYFSPDNRHGRPSFAQILTRIQELWGSQREALTESAANIERQIRILLEREAPPGMILTQAHLRHAAELLKREYDPRYGGFGDAPKFPRPAQPSFLLRYGRRFADPDAVAMILRTCDRMAAGGIHDQLGGGFSRYSVDAQWLVPHFEKMLYDNAQLLQLYLDAFQASGEKKFADLARDIVGYLLRDMTDPGGGFYSAEDADSEGKEGKFYCWTLAELRELLAPDELSAATRYFGVTEEGNFVDHSDPNPLPGQNVLSIVAPSVEISDGAALASARKKMLERRATRVRPHLDDKVLASWNGMMLGALARGAVVLEEPEFLAAAERNLAFLRAKLWDSATHTLYHRWRGGERDSVQLLEAYAHLLAGVIDLYEAALDPSHLEFALDLAEKMIAQFYDAEQGGFWQSGAGAVDLIARVKEDYDGAEPSGNSVAVMSLLKLAEITGRSDFREKAERTLRFLGDRLERLPQAVPNLLSALDFWLDEPKRVVLTGERTDPRFRELLRAAHTPYQPNLLILGQEGPVESFAKSLPVEQEGPMAYYCAGTKCLPPTSRPEELRSRK